MYTHGVPSRDTLDYKGYKSPCQLYLADVWHQVYTVCGLMTMRRLPYEDTIGPLAEGA
jgi:hypothetical protein